MAKKMFAAALIYFVSLGLFGLALYGGQHRFWPMEINRPLYKVGLFVINEPVPAAIFGILGLALSILLGMLWCIQPDPVVRERGLKSRPAPDQSEDSGTLPGASYWAHDTDRRP